MPRHSRLKLTLVISLALIWSCSRDTEPPISTDKISHALNRLKEFDYNPHSDELAVFVDTESQTLFLLQYGSVKSQYPISTARAGTAIESENESLRTPVGILKVSEKIGNGQPIGMRFEGRRPVIIDQIYEHKPLFRRKVDDYVLTRILWLEGLEMGINKGTNRFGKVVDAKKRTIYIHGTNSEFALGHPASNGCIRMSNAGVIELFDLLTEGSLVYTH